MYTALIVDDEDLARRNLHGLLLRYCPEIEKIFVAEDTEVALRFFNTHNIDVLFLDVDLGTATGFDVLPQQKSTDTAVVFVTAHEEYSLRALRAGAVDYLLKPVDIDELREAVGKADTFLRAYKRAAGRQAQEARTTAQPAGEAFTADTHLVVGHGKGFEILDTQQIIFAEADGNYTTFHLDGYRKVIASKQIGAFEALLPASLFFRTHKSYLINLRHLKGYSSHEGYTALLSDSYEIPVSRRRLTEFLELSKRMKR